MNTSAVSSTLASAALAALTILLIIGTTMVQEGGAVPVCGSVESDPSQVPANCKYGTDSDICGRTVCAKGPGRSCGGRRSANGSCGEGLYCACNRCTGCSPTTFECFYGQFC